MQQHTNKQSLDYPQGHFLKVFHLVQFDFSFISIINFGSLCVQQLLPALSATTGTICAPACPTKVQNRCQQCLENIRKCFPNRMKYRLSL